MTESSVEINYGSRLRVRVCGICLQNDQLLMVKHQGMNNASGIFYAPPGGGLEYGESVEDALKREFIEETHLQISVGKLLAVHEFLKPPLHAIELFFEVKIMGGHLQKGHDPETPQNMIAEVMWIPFDKIKLLPPSEVHQIFEKYTNLEQLLNQNCRFY
jgi:8-oxo-dGTP diphosphatase